MLPSLITVFIVIFVLYKLQALQAQSDPKKPPQGKPPRKSEPEEQANTVSLAIDAIYRNEAVSLSGIESGSKGVLQAYLCPLQNETALVPGLISFKSDEIRIPEYEYLESSCQSVSKYVFMSLFFRGYSICESMNKNIGELNTAMIIQDGKIAELINTESSAGYDKHFTVSFEKMKEMKADWGIFTELGTDNKTGKLGITLEIGHPEFGIIFSSPICFDEEHQIISIKALDTRKIGRAHV